GQRRHGEREDLLGVAAEIEAGRAVGIGGACGARQKRQDQVGMGGVEGQRIRHARAVARRVGLGFEQEGYDLGKGGVLLRQGGVGDGRGRTDQNNALRRGAGGRGGGVARGNEAAQPQRHGGVAERDGGSGRAIGSRQDHRIDRRGVVLGDGEAQR